MNAHAVTEALLWRIPLPFGCCGFGVALASVSSSSSVSSCSSVGSSSSVGSCSSVGSSSNVSTASSVSISL